MTDETQKPKTWQPKTAMAWPRMLTKEEREHVLSVMHSRIECNCPICAEGKTPKVEWVEEWWRPHD